MRRFTLILDDEDYNEFLRCFPGHGTRTTLLRKAVHRLVKRAKEAGRIWDMDAEDVADNLADAFGLTKQPGPERAGTRR